MAPSSDEIQYAEKQIDEANRRLESIYERVAMQGYQYTKEEEEDGSVTSEIVASGELDIDPDEFIKKMEEDPSEFEVEPIYNVDDELVASHIQNVVIDCQLCIELAVKSMFKLAGQDHPFSHSISFEDGKTQGFYAELPENFPRKEDVVRVIFLTQFWAQFYELAKYGSPHLNVRPETIFTEDDASRAVNDAEYCIDIAQDLLDYMKGDD